MKLIRNIFLLMFSLILLSACSNPFDSLSKSSGGSDIRTTVEVVDDIGVINQEDIDEEAPMKEYSCNMLKSKSEEDNCKEMINEMIADELYSEIIRTYDIKRCDELDVSRMENCKNHIESTGIKGPVSEDEIESYGNAMGMIYKVTEEEDGNAEGYYDITKCAVLTTPGLKEYCEKKLNERIEEGKLWKIIEGGDVSKCDELTNEDLKNMCKEEFGVFNDEYEEQEEEFVEEELME